MTSITFAYCPGPSAIKYVCTIDTICHWKSEAYQGYTKGEYYGDVTAYQFSKTEWIPIEHKNLGQIVCWYEGQKGTTIIMKGKSTFFVPEPTSDNW